MRFRHPTIRQGQVAHPVHGLFPIRDGVLDCPPELGRELQASPVVEASPAKAGQDAPPPTDAPEVDPPTFGESAAYVEGRQSGLSHAEALELAGLQRHSARPEPSDADLARLADSVRDETEARAKRAAGDSESAAASKKTNRGGKK